MTALRYRWLVLLAALCMAVAGIVVALVPALRPIFEIAWPVAVISGILAVVSLVLAYRVRAYIKDPRQSPIEPVFAARIAVLAQTCAVYGAAVCGWSAGILLYELSLLRYRSGTGSLVLNIVDVAVGALVCVAGCVAESWCKRPPDDRDGSDSGSGIASRRRRKDDLPEGKGGYARDGRR